jgi:hypothetical protein
MRSRRHAIPDIHDLRNYVFANRLVVTEHAKQEATHNGFLEEEIAEGILTGEIVGEQHDDVGTKWLVDGQTYLTRRRVRVVVRIAESNEEDQLIAVTVHELKQRRRR